MFYPTIAYGAYKTVLWFYECLLQRVWCLLFHSVNRAEDMKEHVSDVKGLSIDQTLSAD